MSRSDEFRCSAIPMAGGKFKIDGRWKPIDFGTDREAALAKNQAYIGHQATAPAENGQPKHAPVEAAMASPAAKKKPRKPHPDFPLTAHKGQWIKDVTGRQYRFGPDSDPLGSSVGMPSMRVWNSGPGDERRR
jgi:hypothetical protein